MDGRMGVGGLGTFLKVLEGLPVEDVAQLIASLSHLV